MPAVSSAHVSSSNGSSGWRPGLGELRQGGVESRVEQIAEQVTQVDGAWLVSRLRRSVQSSSGSWPKG